MKNKVLEVKNLQTFFYTDEGVVRSVDGIDFDLNEKETLAIVGESGCGKSVTSLSILRIVQSPPGKIAGGKILFNGKDLLTLSERQMRNIRGNEISMIFQEPMTSLNPVFTVEDQISQVIKIHQKLKKEDCRKRTVEMIKLVGIPDPERILKQYPHQLSGGMRQRVMIAMALACNPKILIADEPTTALDVTIQKQILNLIIDLKEKMDTSVILITHDLGVVAEIADKVMVMYAGQAVEYGEIVEIYKNPKHPYTKGLLKSIPRIDERVEKLHAISGTVPNPNNYPKGCRFADRCSQCHKKCTEEMPEFIDLGNGNKVRCHLYLGGGNNE